MTLLTVTQQANADWYQLLGAPRRCVFVWRWKGSTAGPSQRSGKLEAA